MSMLFSSFFNFRNKTLKSQEVGVEIEVEGENLPNDIPGFIVIGDNSLRGNSAEYVFREPVSLDDSNVLLKLFSNALKNRGTVVFDSIRTSVHVHVNVQHMPIVEVFNFIVLYFLFEDILTHFCGEDREGNLFCLRLKDAEGLILFLENVLETKDLYRLNTDNIRYAALNLSAIAKYGSLEFRAMRGTVDINIIKFWINLLTTLRDKAKMFSSPVDIAQQFSIYGEDNFIKFIFEHIADFIVLSSQEYDSVQKRLRELQPLIFNTDWDYFNFIDEPNEDV